MVETYADEPVPSVVGKRGLLLLSMLVAVSLLAYSVGFDRRQIGAVAIFTGIICGALLFWQYRLAFALFGLAGMLLAGVIDVSTIVIFAGLDIVFFLIGMMIVVGFLEERMFFEHLVDFIISRTGASGKRLIVVLMLLSALFSALVGEVTSILFMAAIMLHCTSRMGLKPVPFLLMIIFATNIGSSATLVGNPVGVMIALRGGLTFTDFLRWATPVSLAVLALSIPICLIYFRKDIRELDAALACSPETEDLIEAPLDRRKFIWSAVFFVGTLATLVSHSLLEEILGLGKNSMLIGIAFIAAGIALVADQRRARELVERRVDWWTLSFFLIFFASVGALEYVGVTSKIAEGLLQLTGTNMALVFLAMIWVVGILSAFMDNVLAVAMFIPIVNELASLGLAVDSLWWALLYSGTLFGNLTMIGSTANIVAIGMLERRKIGHIGFIEWLKPGIVISIPTLALATILLYIQFFL